MELSKDVKIKRIGIVIILIVVIIASLLFIVLKLRSEMESNNNESNNTVNNPVSSTSITDTDDQFTQKIIFNELIMSGKTLQISYFAETPFGVDLGEFVKQDRADDVIEFTNNSKNIGSLQQSFKYFFNEKQLLNEYAIDEGEEYQYEKENLANGNEIYYIQKSKLEDQEEFHAGDGTVLMWFPTIKVGKYEGSQIIKYYNVNLPEEETRGYAYTEDSTVTSTYCIISLDQIDEDELGYLVFEGTSSAGSEVNYCDWLNEANVFELFID